MSQNVKVVLKAIFDRERTVPRSRITLKTLRYENRVPVDTLRMLAIIDFLESVQSDLTP
jgi:hypothetical protein